MLNKYTVSNLIGKKVRHFKGKEYLVLCKAEHTETGEAMIVYKALYGECKVYVRPLEMFISKVDTERYPNINQVFRFELIKEKDTKLGGINNGK